MEDPQRLLQGKLFCSVEYWLERYTFFLDKENAEKAENDRVTFRWKIINAFAGTAVLGVIMACMGHSLLDGTASFPQVFLIWGSIQTLVGVLSDFSLEFTRLAEALRFYRIREQFLATKPLIDEREAKVFRFASVPRLELRNVSFRYPRQEMLVLSGCSLVIKPGEKVALVGENGSGKTTILRLLSKVYLPDEGTVFVDGLPTSRITQACWFKQMLFATQDTGMPNFTLEEAVAGVGSGMADAARLAAAAEYSRFAPIVANLPDGYGTQLGSDWSNGWEPSAGQRQRLKVTAAFYRLLHPGVRVGLFDEPMSACDVETREFFYRGLRNIRDKTIVVVAHDPMYLQCFDRVLLVECGRIVREMRTQEEIAAYQAQVTPQFEEESGRNGLRVVK